MAGVETLSRAGARVVSDGKRLAPTAGPTMVGHAVCGRAVRNLRVAGLVRPVWSLCHPAM